MHVISTELEVAVAEAREEALRRATDRKCEISQQALRALNAYAAATASRYQPSQALSSSKRGKQGVGQHRAAMKRHKAAHHMARRQRHERTLGAVRARLATRQAVRVFLFGAAFAVVSASATAKLSMLDAEVGNAILGLVFIAMLLVGVVVSHVVGMPQLQAALRRLPALQNAQRTLTSQNGTRDWCAAIGVFLAGPPVALYFAVSLAKQYLRRAQAGLLGADFAARARERAAAQGRMAGLPVVPAAASSSYAAAGGHATATYAPSAQTLHVFSQSSGSGGSSGSSSGGPMRSISAAQLATYRWPWLTESGNGHLGALRLLAWENVLPKVMWLGVGFVGLVAGIGRLTTLFLSWLVRALSSTSLPAVTVIMACVGVSMFLLPPIPGVPVYLAGGVLLTASSMRTFEEGGMGEDQAFWCGIVYSSVICFLLKLVAVVLQQEGIGKNLGKKVSVRMAVGVNSTSIRAIGRILGESQLTMRKVVILCGGPDWPTSVLTGILGLSVKKMLIGTLPVYFLILPTCAAGAMELKKAESPLYASLAGIIMAVSAACQAVMGVMAVSAVNHEAELHQQEIRAMPDDEEVAKAEHDAAVHAAAMASAVTWDSMPGGMQKVLQFGGFCMIVCCYILKVRGGAPVCQSVSHRS